MLQKSSQQSRPLITLNVNLQSLLMYYCVCGEKSREIRPIFTEPVTIYSYTIIYSYCTQRILLQVYAMCIIQCTVCVHINNFTVCSLLLYNLPFCGHTGCFNCMVTVQVCSSSCLPIPCLLLYRIIVAVICLAYFLLAIYPLLYTLQFIYRLWWLRRWLLSLTC